VPKEIREYYEKLGLPEIEAKALLGLGAQSAM
jgi:Fe-S cluster assembly protein SufB